MFLKKVWSECIMGALKRNPISGQMPFCRHWDSVISTHVVTSLFFLGESTKNMLWNVTQSFNMIHVFSVEWFLALTCCHIYIYWLNNSFLLYGEVFHLITFAMIMKYLFFGAIRCFMTPSSASFYKLIVIFWAEIGN